jgi:hypothetical protein
MIARAIEVTAEFTKNIISVEAEIATNIKYSELPAYTGETEVTPSNETQTLQTANTALYDNITINPIPSNYGLITWDGSTLTVS